MQNLMIIDNNLDYMSKIINKISNSISNLKIYNISHNINEAMQSIINKNIDIIIININLSGLEILKYIKENNEEKLLFKPECRKYTDRENVNTELKRLLKRHFGIEDITTHSLRHTYGTRCIESGMAPVVVQKLMGHKDVSVTLNTYTSVFDKFKEKEIEKVNKYYLEENMLDSVKLLQNIQQKELEI